MRGLDVLSRLGAVPPVRRAAWTVGEIVHHGAGDARRRRHRPNARVPALPGGGDVVPSYGSVPERAFPPRPRPVRSVANPVLTARDVDDYGDVNYVADPFLYVGEADRWHLFFETFNRDRRPTGVVSHATSRDGGRTWAYDGVVLATDVHLAFPYVFRAGDSYYMVPERWNRDGPPAEVLLYRTDALPGGWEPVSTVVVPDRKLHDCVVFRYDGRWWAMAGSGPAEHGLYLYHSQSLTAAGWTPHEHNPVVSGRPTAARPGGRPLVREDRVVVYFQDCAAQYGDKVRAYEVTRISPTAYADRERPESPVLQASGRRLGWNSGRMHHLDPWYTTDGWVCAVDGNVGFGRGVFGPGHWAIGIYRE